MKNIIKICKYHGELTENQTYLKKLKSGNYTNYCKKCHKLGEKRTQEKRIKILFESKDTDIILNCPNHGGLTKDKLTKTTKRCKQCNTNKHLKWQKKNPEKVKKYQMATKNHPNYILRNRMGFIKRKYSISIEDYKKLLDQQNGVCAICKKEDLTIEANSLRLKGLCIDHCHKTGKVRGLLCNRCNPMIGYSKESIETFQKAIDYLRYHQSSED